MSTRTEGFATAINSLPVHGWPLVFLYVTAHEVIVACLSWPGQLWRAKVLIAIHHFLFVFPSEKYKTKFISGNLFPRFFSENKSELRSGSSQALGVRACKTNDINKILWATHRRQHSPSGRMNISLIRRWHIAPSPVNRNGPHQFLFCLWMMTSLSSIHWIMISMGTTALMINYDCSSCIIVNSIQFMELGSRYISQKCVTII